MEYAQQSFQYAMILGLLEEVKMNFKKTYKRTPKITWIFIVQVVVLVECIQVSELNAYFFSQLLFIYSRDRWKSPYITIARIIPNYFSRNQMLTTSTCLFTYVFYFKYNTMV